MMRRLILGVLLVLAFAAGCSPMPNPNPSSPANQLNGVGSPNQFNPGGGSPVP